MDTAVLDIGVMKMAALDNAVMVYHVHEHL